jgi:acetolactate synthase-1/2/3 large subunit
MNVSEMMAQELKSLGYSHCFYLAGGNIMHLIAAFSQHFVMIPVIHEVTATIAVDNFNELASRSHLENPRKAFALVTVGPGLTQAVTGIVGSYIDGRQLLVIGGQVKSVDLKKTIERQRGMQEVDGVTLIKPYTKLARRIDGPISREEFRLLASESWKNRKGPIFIEVCLDIQGGKFLDENLFSTESKVLNNNQENQKFVELQNRLNLNELQKCIVNSKRPMLLIGGGVSLSERDLRPLLEKWGMPVATTWNASDRIAANSKFYGGRPNWWGQRWANFLIQQCDLLIVVGSSLGYHQTGFNIHEFAPHAKIVHVDIDTHTLSRLGSRNPLTIQSDANEFLLEGFTSCFNDPKNLNARWSNWLMYVQFLREKLPLIESSTELNHNIFLNPYEFIHDLNTNYECDLNIVPCSSGGACTSSMQVIEQRSGDLLVLSKGLGSMGYGIPAAIGAAFSNDRMTLCIEGDGGVLQNIQDLGTIVNNNLPIKLFVLSNEGYASIRGTQEKYFKNKVFGCDSRSGVGLPKLESIAEGFGMEYQKISKIEYVTGEWKEKLRERKPTLFEVFVSPHQVFYPRIESSIQDTGEMVSNPIHKMFPELDFSLEESVSKYIAKEDRG